MASKLAKKRWLALDGLARLAKLAQAGFEEAETEHDRNKRDRRAALDASRGRQTN